MKANALPPPEFGARLTKEEIQSIEQWIRDGARMDQHWSFVSPQRPPLPTTDVPQHTSLPNPLWATHPVDRFVLAKLGSLGLKPSQSATKSELLRRLSFRLDRPATDDR